MTRVHDCSFERSTVWIAMQTFCCGSVLQVENQRVCRIWLRSGYLSFEIGAAPMLELAPPLEIYCGDGIFETRGTNAPTNKLACMNV